LRQGTFLEGVLRRDRGVVLVGLLAVAALGWAYIVYLALAIRGGPVPGGMSVGAGQMAMAQQMPWTAIDFGLMYVMWAAMMMAMMVPTAAPVILVFARVNRSKRNQNQPYVSTGVFLSGYLAVWGGFALFATLSQWGLHQATLMSTMMGSVTPALGGTLLIVAGVFQWTPLKYVCVNHCRTPMGFIMSEWREGHSGALGMGLRHGGYCLGCCWVLMGLMFVAGVMNLLWMAAIAAYILLEKVAPTGTRGNWFSWATGSVLVGWGAWLLALAL
jgi:predicted metal-binding membrane protein